METIYRVDDVVELPDYDPPAQHLYLSYKVSPVLIVEKTFSGGKIKEQMVGVNNRANTSFEIVKEGDGFKIGDMFKLTKL